MFIPNHITHYHSRSDRPFQNLSDLEPVALAQVIVMLQKRNVNNPAYKPVFGSKYMELRQRTEARLRHLFEARGGRADRWALEEVRAHISVAFAYEALLCYNFYYNIDWSLQ